jgi:SAM-dependent methyltransferase
MTSWERLERAAVEFPNVTWTSFDRYSRYGAIVRALRASIGPGRHTVLDVGDSAGHLHAFDADLCVIGLDVDIARNRLEGAVAVLGDGRRLPFPDDAFDVVVTSDVLEHIVPDDRADFLRELRRVSRDLVVVAAPFDTPGVAGVEELARRYALLALGREQPQLEEHRAHGLPDLDETRRLLEEGAAAITVGDGNLWDWLLMMVLRFQIESRPALQPLSDGYDLLYNLSLAGRARIGPFYRHLVVASSAGTPDAGWESAGDAASVDMAGLLAALIAADSTEVTRQDTVPRLDALSGDLTSARGRLEVLDARTEMATSETLALRAEVGQLRERLNDVAERADQIYSLALRSTAPLRKGKQLATRIRNTMRALADGQPPPP